MENTKDYYEEAIRYGVTSFTSTLGLCVVYKGFKVYQQGEEGDYSYTIKDARFLDILEDISEEHKKLFNKEGFIKGVDTISYNRDLDRINKYQKITEGIYDRKRGWKKTYKSNPKLNRKRLRNAELRIDDNIGQIFFYRTRVKQFKIKYNITN